MNTQLFDQLFALVFFMTEFFLLFISGGISKIGYKDRIVSMKIYTDEFVFYIIKQKKPKLAKEERRRPENE